MTKTHFSQVKNLQAKKILILATLITGLPLKAKGAKCYDPTTNHPCSKISSSEKRVASGGSDSFNNTQLKKNYEVQVMLNALSQKSECGTASQTAQNIQDLHKVIEQSKLPEKEKFICTMEVKIRKQNKQILKDREFMTSYIKKKKAKASINKEDQIKMTSLLIKYRLLKNKKKVCSPYASNSICFFASTRFSVPSEAIQKIQNAAVNYVSKVGEPSGCVVNGKERPVQSRECEEEILSRVQAIPAPLILAQAVQESGWGESSWAKEYANFLGLQVKFSNPKTMSCYKNCRCSGEYNNRCALNFKDAEGCFYEYAMRFNASPLEDYKKFRDRRSQLPNMDKSDQLKTQCQNARELTPYLEVYAEDPNYIPHICHQLNTTICKKLKKCPQYKITVTQNEN